jgi:hypothetical protein
MMMSGRLTELLINRIAEAMAEGDAVAATS